jgi:hypothetical protein
VLPGVPPVPNPEKGAFSTIIAKIADGYNRKTIPFCKKLPGGQGRKGEKRRGEVAAPAGKWYNQPEAI